MTSLAQYSAARAALATATRVEEVLPLRRQMAHIKLHARQVQDRELLADAMEIQIRAERRLGELLCAAETEGLIGPGRPRKPDAENPTRGEGFTLKEIGVSHKLSARAQQTAALSPQAVEALIETTRDRIVSGRAKLVDESPDKAERRAVREAELAGRITTLPDRRYGVIVADPEWRFEPWSRATGLDRAADNHYPTSCTEVIAARDVASIAADDCVLFLWGTVPMLPQALLVMGAWGFDYRSNFVWAKDRLGTGYWNRNVHEHLLLGVKGYVPCPAPGEQWESLLHAPTAAHSQKPELFLELVEHYFPTLPKIELNRRGPARPGWDAWGNEAGERAA